MLQRIFVAIDKVLFKGQTPRVIAKLSDEEIVRLTNEIVMVDSPFEFQHSFKSRPPFNLVTNYYRKVVDLFKYQAMHEINRLLTSDEVPCSRIERLHEDIKEELYVRLRRCLAIINSLELMVHVGDMDSSGGPDTGYLTNYYVYNYIRLTLIQILAEMHIHFRDLVTDRLYMGESSLMRHVSIYDLQVTEEVAVAMEPDASLDAGRDGEKAGAPVADARTETVQPCEPVNNASDPAVFVAVFDNVRPPKKGIGKYKDMVRYPKRLGLLEEHFVRVGIIDTNYRFRNQHGHKKLLAAIYHLMIDRNTFNPVNDTWRRHIHPTDVRRFLDYRYGVNLDKQFQPSSLGAEERANLIDSFDWLRYLPYE